MNSHDLWYGDYKSWPPIIEKTGLQSFEIIRRKPREDGHEWILAHILGDAHFAWVVWMRRSYDGTVHWGHYYDDPEKAEACFDSK